MFDRIWFDFVSAYKHTHTQYWLNLCAHQHNAEKKQKRNKESVISSKRTLHGKIESIGKAFSIQSEAL